MTSSRSLLVCLVLGTCVPLAGLAADARLDDAASQAIERPGTTGAASSDAPLRVGMFNGPGTGSTKALDDLFASDSGVAVKHLAAADLRPEVLSQFDVVLFPGGSGSKQAAAIGPEASKHVQDFVRGGGGYVGICAGAYLCSSKYDWSLNLIDTSVYTGMQEIPGKGRKSMWYRGTSHTVQIELTDAGREILGDEVGLLDVRYHNGPIVSPAGRPELPTYLPLAHFRSEVVLYEPQRGTMIGTPAITTSTYGTGRVLSISPHLESKSVDAEGEVDARNHAMLLRAVRWSAGRPVARQEARVATPAEAPVAP